MSKILVITVLCFAWFTNLRSQTKADLTANWASVTGNISSMHWGYNDFSAKTQLTPDKGFVDFGQRLNPGIVRIHQAGLIAEWSNPTKKCWDTLKIKTCLDNATKGYENAKILLTFSDWPAFITTQQGTVPLDKEQALEDYFAQLPGVLKSINHHVDYYEFLNENDESYANGIGIDKYALLIKRLSIRIKAEVAKLSLGYPVMVGGSAIRWPNPAWYQPIINLAGKYIDFFSWHHYAAGPIASGVSEEQRNIDIFANVDWIAGSAIKDIRSYAVSKGCGNLKFFIDEFSVQYVWSPYEPRTHNNVGAVWYASIIKRMVDNKLDGAMCWNGKDGAYGLIRGDNSISAPGSLYLWSTNYLRGDVVKTTSTVSKLEMMAVKRTNGHSVLLINRSANSYSVANIMAMLAETNGSKLKAACIDASVKNGDNWIPKSVDVSSDNIVITPWSLVLITNVADATILPVEKLGINYILHNSVKLSWVNPNKVINGFNILLDNKKIGYTKETSYIVNSLSPSGSYTIGIAPVDEFWVAHDTVSVNAETISKPLLVNDQTTGTKKNHWSFSGNWKAVYNSSYFNGDASESTTIGNSASISFAGSKISVFGNKVSGVTKVKVLIDGNESGTIDANSLSSDYGLLWLSGDLTEGNHSLRLELVSGTKVSIDYAGIYSPNFQEDHTAPNQVAKITDQVTFKTLSLNWPEPVDQTGVQGYYLSVNNQPTDTVYSPKAYLSDLQPETQYQIGIVAFDVNLNKSAEAVFNVSTVALNYQSVYATTTPPLIDGVKDEIWNTVKFYDLSALTKNSTNVGQVACLWDKNYLYLLVDVKKNDSEANDVVEVFYDANNTKASNYGLDDYWFQFNRQTGITKEMYHNGTANAKFKTTDTGYIFEVAFKWSVIRTTGVKPLYTFGFDIHVSSGLPEAANYQSLSWQPLSANAGTDTNVLGNLQLIQEVTSAKYLLSKDNEMSLYPNPTSGDLYVSTNGNKVIDVCAKSVSGKNETMAFRAVSPGQLVVNVSNLISGSYVLHVRTDQKVLAKKFIKE